MRHFLGQLHQTLARSRTITWLAVKLSNQCRRIITYHIHRDGHAIDANGEAWLINELAKSYEHFVDVGANVGDWTMRVLESQPGARVLMFEPGQKAADKLSQRLNGTRNIELVHAAVSDSPGTLNFYEEPDAGETSSLISSFSHPSAIKREVPVTTLDIEINKRGWERIDFLKIDVEGYDFHVIRGASCLLHEQRIGIIQFEYGDPWEMAGSTIKGCSAMLEGLGYQVFLLTAKGLHKLRLDFYPEYFGYANFVAVSPENLPLVSSYIRGTV